MRSLFTKYSFICYGLIALGQLWLYSLNLRTTGFYERITLNSYEWIGSHIVLLLGAILIFPATIVLKNYCKGKSRYLVHTATALTLLGALALIGQYCIDFYLIALFEGQTSESSYEALDLIQSNTINKVLFYDLIAAWLLGQILFVVALFKMKNYPKWALIVFVLGISMTIFGDNFHELLERLSYVLVTIALLPIVNEKA